jgi:hypothetical protein
MEANIFITVFSPCILFHSIHRTNEVQGISNHYHWYLYSVSVFSECNNISRDSVRNVLATFLAVSHCYMYLNAAAPGALLKSLCWQSGLELLDLLNIPGTVFVFDLQSPNFICVWTFKLTVSIPALCVFCWKWIKWKHNGDVVSYNFISETTRWTLINLLVGCQH